MDETIKYATFAFDVADSLKVKSIREQAKDLAYCGLKIEVAVERLGLTSIDQIWASQVEECSLWNARLFPVCATREVAAESAVNMLQALKTSTDISTDLSGMSRLSLEDMLQYSSLKEALSYMDRMWDECSKV